MQLEDLRRTPLVYPPQSRVPVLRRNSSNAANNNHGLSPLGDIEEGKETLGITIKEVICLLTCFFICSFVYTKVFVCVPSCNPMQVKWKGYEELTWEHEDLTE